MRLTIVSLIALAAAANAYAQAAPAQTSPPPAPPAAAPATSPATTPATGAAPAAGEPGAEAPAAPPAPPPPPPPPTDPAAVAVLSTLQTVCIPAANGGNFVQLAKAAGLRKQSDGWVERQKDFTLVVANPSVTNPSQCEIDLTHPADLEAPGRPIIVALNDWATGSTNGWSLYRNDKSVQEGMQYTTRSWQLDWNGKEQSLVFTTKRRPDGTPLKPNTDQSQLIYGVQKIG